MGISSTPRGAAASQPPRTRVRPAGTTYQAVTQQRQRQQEQEQQEQEQEQEQGQHQQEHGRSHSNHEQTATRDRAPDESLSSAEPPWLEDQRQHRRAQPNYTKDLHKRHVPANPFDTSSDSSSATNNPFDDPVNSICTTGSGSSMTAKHPHNPTNHQQSSKSVATDSLDQLLDTTEDTVEVSTTGTDNHHDDNPDTYHHATSHSSVVDDAIANLKQSFHTRKSCNSTATANPSPRPCYLSTPPPSSYATSVNSSSPSYASTMLTSTPRTPRMVTPTTASSRFHHTRTGLTPSTPQQSSRNDQEEEHSQRPHFNPKLELHDLCDEATSSDDLAWHNALFLLSIKPHLTQQLEPENQMNPLHICCLSTGHHPKRQQRHSQSSSDSSLNSASFPSQQVDQQQQIDQPPPIWMIRALLYTRPEQCQEADAGGRLPLHLLVATSADLAAMQLLVEEYPPSIAHKDLRGFTPLHLLLKNDQIQLTVEHLRILLGQSVQEKQNYSTTQYKRRPLLFRKKQHLEQTYQDLAKLQERQQAKHEGIFHDYPNDVQSCLRKIKQWKLRQSNKQQAATRKEKNDNDKTDANEPSRKRLVDFNNPSAIATPTAQLLPLHLVVRRTVRASPPNRLSARTPPARHAELVRTLVAAYPEALVTKDIHGRTPLMAALLQTDRLPDDEVVELLLGLRTPGFGFSLSTSPAKLASEDAYQLPLHVAAEECLDHYGILSTIYEAYPEARTVQDIRGRTPLHLALANYRGIPLDASTCELLLNEDVARIRDDDGKLPIDLIMEHPNSITPPQHHDGHDNCRILVQAFLDASISRPRNWMEQQELLRQLRVLPPWLRRYACAAKFVQQTLLEELASPWNTSIILLSGLATIGLLVVLRLSLNRSDLDTWILVHYFASYLLATQLIHWVQAAYLGEFTRLVLGNVWRWIDLSAACLSIGTTYLVQTNVLDSMTLSSSNSFLLILSDEDELIAMLGAWATGLVWLSLLGYLVQWWCGMAMYIGSAVALMSILFWPLVVGCIGLVAMSQILFTAEDCANDNICSLSDAYTTIYYMMLGQPVLGGGYNNDPEVSKSMLVLLIFCTILLIWWLVSVICIAVGEAHRLDRFDVALKWYWEPKVSLTVFAFPQNPRLVQRPSFTQRYCERMELAWTVLTSALFGGASTTEQRFVRDYHWHVYCLRPRIMWVTRLLALLILPAWCILGMATFGVLWPPQIRRWVFLASTTAPRCSLTNRNSIIGRRKETLSTTTREEILSATKLSRLKAELVYSQKLSSQQNEQLQEDILQIKDILFRAMMEE